MESSVPIILDDCIWIIRILYNTITNRLYLDVREWKETSNNLTDRYDPTMNGICLPLPNWIRLLEPMYKLLLKYKEKK